MHDDVHIRSDGCLIYNRQDGCVDTSFCQMRVCQVLGLRRNYRTSL